MKQEKFADLFCGAGGLSTGLRQACAILGVEPDLLAVNHWEVAVATHTRNHRQARHMCATIEQVNPRKAIPGGKLRLLLAAPECTHHSNARGGKPMSDQSRATAYNILDWASALDIADILIENVKEFRDWGPLHPADHPDPKKANRPIPELKGRMFRDFLRSLRGMGYAVDYRLLRAADYGDATTRERLFIRASRTQKRITWPDPTHLPTGRLSLYGDVKPWRSAREIIDWSLQGKSIFGRKTPLRPNTLRRIFAGLEKYSGLPFVIGQQSCAAPRSTSDPLPTIAGAGAISMVQPFLIGAGGPTGQGEPQCVDDPIGTILGQNHRALVEPFIVPFFSENGAQKPRCLSVDDPLTTVTAQGRLGLAEPYLVVFQNNRDSKSLDEPLPTVLTSGAHFGLANPYLTMFHGGKDGHKRVYSVDEPVRTLDTSNRVGVAQPVLIPFYGNAAGGHSVEEPLRTATTNDRFGLAEPMLIKTGKGEYYKLDILFRMLQPHELSAAMGFPADYEFEGNREQKVKQIGNAVCVNLATALCHHILARD